MYPCLERPQGAGRSGINPEKAEALIGHNQCRRIRHPSDGPVMTSGAEAALGPEGTGAGDEVPWVSDTAGGGAEG